MAVQTVLVFEISRIMLYNIAKMFLDAKACYDRIVLCLAALRSRHLGVPTAACSLLTGFLEKAEYTIKTMVGLSDESYTSTDANPLHGPGQGAREAPALWLILSVMLIALMHKKARGISFSDPWKSNFVHRVMDGFVDDTTAWLNFFLESFDHTRGVFDHG